MATKEEMRLIEKIARAKMTLERSRVKHRDTCPSEDPYMTGNCNCGADAANSRINSAIRELSFD